MDKNNSEFKRVLILGQNFNDGTGAGVTLTNLFRDWDKNKLALATTGDLFNSKDFSNCSRIYLLGKKEFSVRFPFSLLQKKYESGPVDKNTNAKAPVENLSQKNRKMQKVFSKYIDFLRYIGVYNYLRTMTLSEELYQWAKEFDPELIYVQPSSSYLIHLTLSLQSRLQVPLAIHQMDDWLSSSAGHLFYSPLLKKQFISHFMTLLERTAIPICISDAMAENYTKAYGRNWHVFHNSINVENWKLPTLRDKNKQTFDILYMGRVGISNKYTLENFIRFVTGFNKVGRRLTFHIYTLDYGMKFLENVQDKNIVVHPPVPHSQVSALVGRFDLLLLPLDFDKESLKFAKLSMPTKMTEYMASGVPVLVIAPEDSAIYQYSKKNRVAFVCNTNNIQKIETVVSHILIDEETREEFSANGRKIAFEHHDVDKESKRFINLINSAF